MSVTAATPRLASFDRDASRSPRPLWEYVRQSGLQSLVACASKNPNAKFTVLLVSPTTRRAVHAVKVPTTDIAAAAVEAEAQMHKCRSVWVLTAGYEDMFARLGYRKCDRKDVPEVIRTTRQYADLCPADAQVMMKQV